MSGQGNEISMNSDTNIPCVQDIFPIATNDNFGECVARAASRAKLIVLEFGADWCPPCKQMRPLVHNVVDQHPLYDLFYINVDDDDWRDLIESHGVESIPHTDILNPTMPWVRNEPIIGADIDKLKTLMLKIEKEQREAAQSNSN